MFERSQSPISAELDEGAVLQAAQAHSAYDAYTIRQNAKIDAWIATEKALDALKASEGSEVDSEMLRLSAEVQGIAGRLNFKQFIELGATDFRYLEKAVSHFQAATILLGTHSIQGRESERAGRTIIDFAPQGALACRILGGVHGAETKSGIVIADVASYYAQINPGLDDRNIKIAKRAQLFAKSRVMPKILQGPASALAFAHEYPKFER